MQKIDLKKNAIKIAIVLLNIFLIVSLLLVLVFKNDYGYSLYLVICPFLIVVVSLLINKRITNVERRTSKKFIYYYRFLNRSYYLSRNYLFSNI